MDGCCHGENLNILLINRHKSYIVTADQIVSMTKNRACACLLVGYLGFHHGNIHPSIHPCLVSFLFIPSLYSLFGIERFFIYLSPSLVDPETELLLMHFLLHVLDGERDSHGTRTAGVI